MPPSPALQDPVAPAAGSPFGTEGATKTYPQQQTSSSLDPDDAKPQTGFRNSEISVRAEDIEEGEVDEETAEAFAEAKVQLHPKTDSDPINPGQGGSANPPLPAGPPPEDDGWDFHWDAAHQAYFFHNRFTSQTTWENPRVPAPNPATAGAADASSSSSATTTTIVEAVPAVASGQQDQPLLNSASLPPPPSIAPPAGGYNPAIHGDYDPNAWYAKVQEAAEEAEEEAQSRAAAATAEMYSVTSTFNRFTGRFQQQPQPQQQPQDEACGANRHSDEAKSRRQLNSFFDVDAAANQHDGRSLRAERSGIKPSKKELKRFKEKRRAKKEEKRRAWLKE